MLRRIIPVALIALLAACQLSLPGSGGGTDAAGNPITGDAIETVALDAPEAARPATAPRPNPRRPAAGPAGPAANPAAAPRSPAQAADLPAPDAAAVNAALSEALAPPPPPKSESQIACERRKGVYQEIGDSGAFACVRVTRDAGKQCRRESDCESACLARSRTCAPFTPLFGCHEVLMQSGARVTQCVN